MFAGYLFVLDTRAPLEILKQCDKILSSKGFLLYLSYLRDVLKTLSNIYGRTF